MLGPLAEAAHGKLTWLGVKQPRKVSIKKVPSSSDERKLDGSEIDRINSTLFDWSAHLRLGEKIHGALVFIRFGGPEFTTTKSTFRNSLQSMLLNLLDHATLVAQIAKLEARTPTRQSTRRICRHDLA